MDHDDLRWEVLGVPSSAGGHTPGMDLAPRALRDAGLLTRLSGQLIDHGDVSGFRRVPDPAHLDRQNIEAVARVAGDTAAAVASIAPRGGHLLVVGGDCTVTVGVVAGMRLAGLPPALLYLDGGPDLYTPGLIEHGNVDGMGLAHLLALPGSDPVLSDIGAGCPLLQPDDVVVYGDAVPDDPRDPEFVLLRQLGLARIPATRVHEDVVGAAQAARTAIEDAGERFLVHFDVDVLGHAHLPLANMPNPDAPPWGLTIAEVTQSLAIICASPRFAGIVLTEVNPHHAPSHDHLLAYVDLVGAGLSGVT